MSSTEVSSQPTPLRRSSALLLWIPLLIVVLLIGITAFGLHGQMRIAAAKGIVQGLGEPLPISSSAHLIVTPWLFKWDDAFFESQTFDVALHMGTLIALIGFFWRDWVRLIVHAHKPKTPDGRLFWLIVLASVPGALIGFVLDKYAENFFGDKYLLIAATLSIMGIVLYLADTYAAREYDLEHISWKMALLIGLSQAFALIPGVSRSGSTMTMGRALKLRRETAARFSFLMAIPITFGAGLLKLRHLDASAMTAPFWLGIVMSFVVGVLAVGFLLRYVKTRSFLPFVIYRLAFAALIVAVYFMRQG
ncbi:MAG: undecaprenyl-diphosphate phosphatase [Herpetosiphon sp.]|nr:undecaprenyl-diphosphate phosphatase [Herpetosiphon sp.]